MNKRGEGNGWIVLIVIVFILLALCISYDEGQEQEIKDLQANITKLSSDFNRNITITTIEKEICENKLSVVIQDKYKSINYNEAICEEFC